MANEFQGEGNPSDASVPPAEDLDIRDEVFVGPDGRVKVYLTPAELQALRTVLAREITSRPSYDGLRQILSLTHGDAEALLGLLRRVCF